MDQKLIVKIKSMKIYLKKELVEKILKVSDTITKGLFWKVKNE